MYRLIYLWFFTISVNICAQINTQSNSYNAGLGTSITTSIDFSALNANPSNLGWQNKFYKHQFSFKIFDLTSSYYSPVNVNYVLNDVVEGSFINDDIKVEHPIISLGEILGSYYNNTVFDTTFTLQEREAMSKVLQEKSALHFNRVLFGASYTTQNHGTFAVQISNEMIGSFQLSQNAANLLILGKSNPYFDSLVLSDGTIIPNTYPTISNDTLVQIVHAFSSNPITVGEQLQGSNFQYMKTRNFTLGWGNHYKQFIKGWESYIGVSVNFIQGKSYQDWKTENNEFYLRDAGDVNFANSDRGVNPGKGFSLNLGLSLIKNDQLIIGASLRNLGLIRWSYSKNNAVLNYSSENETLVFDYQFGASPTIDFSDQWSQANLFISSGQNYNETGRFVTATPASFACGAKYLLYKQFHLSADVVLPIIPKAIGSIQIPYIAIGAELELKKFALTTGFNNNFGQFNMPFGISIGSKKSSFAFNISTYDLINYFEGKNMQNLSLGAGLIYRGK